MIEIDEIINFLRTATCTDKEILPETTLHNDFGVCGDDMWELLEEYSQKFNVDLSGFLWYFHSAEEGVNFGGLFFKPPDERVPHIPITVMMLCEYANSGKWSLLYPPHQIPEHRIDILINKIIGSLMLIGVVIVIILKLVR